MSKTKYNKPSRDYYGTLLGRRIMQDIKKKRYAHTPMAKNRKSVPAPCYHVYYHRCTHYRGYGV